MPGAAVVLEVAELAAVPRLAAVTPEALPGPEVGAGAAVSAGLLLAPGHGLPAPGPRVARHTDTPGARLHQGPAHAAVLAVAGVSTDVGTADTLPVIA